MRNHAFDYYLHDGPSAFRFQLMGFMNHEGARRLEQVFQTASSLFDDRRPIIDITFVTGIDEQGTALLVRWHRAGARFVANSKGSRALAESVLGAPLPAPQGNPRRRLPFRLCFFKSAATLPLLLTSLLLTFPASAANLKSETVAAGDNYLDRTQADLRERIARGSFLWTLEDPARAARVRAGETIVAPAPGPSPINVPGGLIHHWMGAIFLPGLTVDQVVEVTRDYDRYEDFYQPSVVESATVGRDDAGDQFTMRMMNRTLFMRTALDAGLPGQLHPPERAPRLQRLQDHTPTGNRGLW